MALLNPVSFLRMMRILEIYDQAINLDRNNYDYYFPEGVKRAFFCSVSRLFVKIKKKLRVLKFKVK